MTTLRYFDNIRFGSYTDLEVLVDPSDNSLWVGQPSMARMLGWVPDDARKKLASKGLKAFANKRLAGAKTIQAKDSLGRANKINAIPYDTFLAVVYWQMTEGNENAKALMFAGFADSFSSIVLEQCGIKLSLDQRQQTLDFYLKGYHAFQDWVRDTHLAVHGVKPDNDYYRQVAVEVNRYLFSRSHFKQNRKVYASDDQLRQIENFQMQFMVTPYSRRKTDPLKSLLDYMQWTLSE